MSAAESDAAAPTSLGVFTGRTAWARNLAAPVRDFLNTETGGALVLLGAALAALAVGELAVVGLLRVVLDHEALDPARQLGHLAGPAPLGERGADDVLLPRRRAGGQARDRHGASCATGGGSRSHWWRRSAGWRCRSLIFLAFNAGGAGAHGWGAAMSTDTAFALGVLALVAPGGTRLRVSPAHARGRRRPRGAAGDRHGVHASTCRSFRSRSPSGCSASCSRCATRRARGAGQAAGRRWASASGSRCSSRASIRSSPGSRVGPRDSAYPPAAQRPRAGRWS